MSQDFGIFMPKHFAVQWLLNSYCVFCFFLFYISIACNFCQFLFYLLKLQKRPEINSELFKVLSDFRSLFYPLCTFLFFQCVQLFIQFFCSRKNKSSVLNQRNLSSIRCLNQDGSQFIIRNRDIGVTAQICFAHIFFSQN